MKELALIGKGRWGERYIQTIKDVEGCNLKYIVSRDYSTVENVDGVIIATPPETHEEIMKHFSCPILCEKPLVTTLSGLRIDGEIMTGFTHLYNKKLQAWKSRSVNSIQVTLGNTEPYSKSSAIWEMGIHGIAISLFLLGYPKEVKALKIEDNFQVILVYDNAQAVIEYGYCYSEKVRKILINDEDVSLSVQTPRELELQIRDFLDFIDGKEVVPNLEFSKNVTEIALIIEKKLNYAKS